MEIEEISEINEIKKFHERAKSEYAELRAKISALKKEKRLLIKKIGELEQKASTISADILEKQRDIARKETALDKKQKELFLPIEEKEREIAKKQQQVNEKEKDIIERENKIAEEREKMKTDFIIMSKQKEELDGLDKYLFSLQRELENKIDQQNIELRKSEDISFRKSQDLEQISLLKKEQQDLLKKIQIKVEAQDKRGEALKRWEKQIIDQAKRLSSERAALDVAWKELNYDKTTKRPK